MTLECKAMPRTMRKAPIEEESKITQLLHSFAPLINVSTSTLYNRLMQSLNFSQLALQKSQRDYVPAVCTPDT